MYCPNCGTKCEDTHHYCYKCGSALPDLTEEAPVQVVEESVGIPVETAAPVEIPVAENQPEQLINAYVETGEDVSVPDAPPPKKGRLWPPILAMAVMIIIGLTAFFFAGRPPVSEAPWFTVEDGTLYFNEALYSGSDELIVPATVDGQTVTAIGSNAFSGCTRISTVILPETVTQINDSAFSGCTSLRGIFIPNTVKSVGGFAFANCTSLEAIYVCSTLEAMGSGALDGCTALHYIFYDGTYEQWIVLYDGSYDSNVELHAADGTYYSKP